MPSQSEKNLPGFLLLENFFDGDIMVYVKQYNKSFKINIPSKYAKLLDEAVDELFYKPKNTVKDKTESVVDELRSVIETFMVDLPEGPDERREARRQERFFRKYYKIVELINNFPELKQKLSKETLEDMIFIKNNRDEVGYDWSKI